MSKQLLHVFLFVLLIGSLSGQLRGQNSSLVKQTFSHAGGSFEYNSQGRSFTVQQSIGQSSVIGSGSTSEAVVFQGFLTPVRLKLTRIQEEDLNLSVFPNPFNDHFVLEFDEGPVEDVQVEVFDLSGRLVFSNVYPSALILSVDQLSLNRGAYILNVRVGNSSINLHLQKL